VDGQNEIQEINIERIIAGKNPKLLKLMPGFVLNYVKKTLHLKHVNEFLKENKDKKDADFIKAVIDYFEIKIVVKGIDNLPASGGVIIASNHPLGGLDGLALMLEVSKVRKDFLFLVNDILTNLKNISGLFVPINKHGKNAAQSVERIEKEYASDKAVIIFPAGLVSRKQDGVIKDLEWKKSVITKAKKHKKNIIPVYIDAKNSGFFYNLALWRKRLGVNANIEMFYLVDEMYKQHGKTITITFGKAISYDSFDKTKSDLSWAEWLKQKVYSMAKQ
jgi:putative hemolysin